jgi:hypothetical protein
VLLTQQVRQAVNEIDMPKLQQEMKDQQKQIQKQMQDLSKDLESLRSHAKYNEMY